MSQPKKQYSRELIERYRAQSRFLQIGNGLQRGWDQGLINGNRKAMIAIDKEAWEKGVRDGFRTGIAGLCPATVDPYSYWRGWKEGDAARHGEDITEDVARICGLVK